MATRESIPPALIKISGVIPLTRTIFTWQSIATAVIIIAASVLVAYLSAPTAERAKVAEDLGVRFETPIPSDEKRRAPGEWLEYNGILTVLICAIGFGYLAKLFLAKGPVGGLRPQHLQSALPDAGNASPLDSESIYQGGDCFCARHGRRTDSVSLSTRASSP